MIKFLCILLVALLVFSCQADVTVQPGGESVQLFAATVGKGDALILKVDDWAALIDTGKPHVRGKVLSALEYMGVTELDAVFITHTDNDHIGGLEWLPDTDIPVGAWYAPALYTGVKEGKHPMLQAAAKRGEEVQWLRRGDTIALGDTGAFLDVLAPAQRFTDKDDNNSLVMLLTTAQGDMLLTGDMELPEESDLLSRGDDLSAAVLKVANHADNDTTSRALAEAVRPQAAIISTDSQEKPGTPDPDVIARLNAVGAVCHVTQDAGLGLLVTLQSGTPKVDYVDISLPVSGDVCVQRVIPGDDLVTLVNNGSACDMTGWYLYSDRGGELYPFPDGYVLPAGGSVTVGSKSSDGGYDLLWNDKKVIHKSKSDTIYLYDRFGRYVDSQSNGY